MYQSLILTFIIIIVFLFPQIQSYVPCKRTYRACPDGYICSEDGVFCKQNGKPDLRSNWSLLGSKCLDKYFCGPDAYCLDYLNKCVRKDISQCDAYLNLIVKSGCNNSFLTESFDSCGKNYLQQHIFPHQHNSIVLCADSCIRTKISDRIAVDSSSCVYLEQHAVESYDECYSNCGACFVQSTWSILLKNVHGWGNITTDSQGGGASLKVKIESLIGLNFAKLCNAEYFEKLGTWSLPVIQEMARDLNDKILMFTNTNTTYVFSDLLALNAPYLIEKSRLLFGLLFFVALFLIIFVTLIVVWCNRRTNRNPQRGKTVELDENGVPLLAMNLNQQPNGSSSASFLRRPQAPNSNTPSSHIYHEPRDVDDNTDYANGPTPLDTREEFDQLIRPIRS